jgi:hypothetical protein
VHVAGVVGERSWDVPAALRQAVVSSAVSLGQVMGPGVFLVGCCIAKLVLQQARRVRTQRPRYQDPLATETITVRTRSCPHPLQRLLASAPPGSQIGQVCLAATSFEPFESASSADITTYFPRAPSGGAGFGGAGREERGAGERQISVAGERPAGSPAVLKGSEAGAGKVRRRGSPAPAGGPQEGPQHASPGRPAAAGRGAPAAGAGVAARAAQPLPGVGMRPRPRQRQQQSARLTSLAAPAGDTAALPSGRSWEPQVGSALATGSARGARLSDVLRALGSQSVAEARAALAAALEASGAAPLTLLAGALLAVPEAAVLAGVVEERQQGPQDDDVMVID